jgi:serine/threonine-protein kinase SBK
MALPRILRHPSRKNCSAKKSEVPLLVDPYEDLLIRDIDIPTEFDIIKSLHEGSFSKVLLVRKRHCSRERLALKVISDENLEGFYRELNYNYFLSPHPSVVNCYNVSIQWDDSFVFPLEYAPFGNLERFLGTKDTNSVVVVTEAGTKLIAKQLASALEFMHSLKLIHRDICPENILVFKQDFSQIKLCDFGSTRPEKSLVTCLQDRRGTSPCPGASLRNSPRPSSLYINSSIISSQHNTSIKDLYRLPPEICGLVKGESYYTHSSSDVWQVGILLYGCLTGGGEPWQSAEDILDPNFTDFLDWLRRKSLRIPEPFQMFTPRLLRLLKRIFEPKPKKRCGVEEIYKYLEDEWISKLYRGSSFRRGVLERKASSSTSRSRSTGRNSSTRRKSVRITNSSSCNGVNHNGASSGSPSNNNNIVKESSPVAGGGNSLVESREKMSELDRDFVKDRVGRWILEASNKAVSTSLSP